MAEHEALQPLCTQLCPNSTNLRKAFNVKFDYNICIIFYVLYLVMSWYAFAICNVNYEFVLVFVL